MAEDPFIDPLLRVSVAGVAALVKAATVISDTGAFEGAASAAESMAWLPVIAIGATIIGSAIKLYDNKKRSKEAAAKERKRSEEDAARERKRAKEAAAREGKRSEEAAALERKRAEEAAARERKRSEEAAAMERKRSEEDAARERKRSEEDAARERRSEEVLEQHARRNEENLLRHDQEVREFLTDQANCQELALVQSEQRQAQAREMAAIDAVIHDLGDSVSLYENYQRQYANDQPRLVEETKLFQRNIGAFLMKLSNAMLRCRVNLDALRVWANAAAFQIQMISNMRDAGIESTESLRIAVDTHRETARNLCSNYRSDNQLSRNIGDIREVEMYFHDASNYVEYPISRNDNVNTSQTVGCSNQTGTETQNNECVSIEMAASPHSGIKLVMVLSALVGIFAMAFVAVVRS